MEAWKWYRWRKYDLPAQAMSIASKVPFLGSKKLQTQAALITKVANNMQKIEEGYTYFRERHWIYDDKEYCKVCDSLNEHDKEEFFIDLRKIDMQKEGKNYQHGLAKYYLHEDIPAIDSGLK
jgi:hypothetical protein